MNCLSVSALFFIGLIARCSGQSCLENYKEGMNKCFSDLTTLTKDEVISVLMEEQENARVSDIICRKDAQIIECVENMTTATSQTPPCADMSAQFGILSVTSGLKSKISVLCGKGTQPQTVNH
ncbi:uncharacterized protein LOC111131104 isoform X2 [Crassostrea virginica]